MTLVADFNPNVSVPFSRMRYLLQESAGLQAGVVGANDFKVVQRGAGANMSVDVGTGGGWLQVTTGTRNGLVHCFNDATANVVVTASSGSNPRIDQIILRYNDSTIPTGSGDVPTLAVVTGTATAGATLDNRTGAAALPADSLRLADILVPTSSTSVVTANIRDRRPWARGAHHHVTYAGGNITYTGALARIDTTNLEKRIECSGMPLIVELEGSISGGGTTAAEYSLSVDAAEASNCKRRGTAGTQATHLVWQLDSIAAGSHLIAPMWGNSAAGQTILASLGYAVELKIYELVRANSSN